MGFFAVQRQTRNAQGVDTIWFPDLNDHIVRVIRARSTFYECDLLEHLEQVVPRGGVIVDVGANIGNHTVFFAKYMASTVIALEPEPRNFAVLQQTVSRNGLRNVVCLQLAASDHSGSAKLALAKGFEGNPGAYAIRGASDCDSPISISIDTLDNLIQQCDCVHKQRVTLIKIDVEGHEEFVLRGSRGTLARWRPHLAVEIPTRDVFRSIARDLRQLRYRAVGCFCATPTYHFAAWSLLRSILWRLTRRAADRRDMARVFRRGIERIRRAMTPKGLHAAGD